MHKDESAEERIWRDEKRLRHFFGICPILHRSMSSFTPGCCVWLIFSKSDCPFRLSLYKLCANKGGVSHVKCKLVGKLVAICEPRLISTLRIMIRDDCGS